MVDDHFFPVDGKNDPKKILKKLSPAFARHALNARGHFFRPPLPITPPTHGKRPVENLTLSQKSCNLTKLQQSSLVAPPALPLVMQKLCQFTWYFVTPSGSFVFSTL